jgi:formylglycine-generating enzyme
MAYVLNVTADMTVKAWFSLRQVHYDMKLITGGTFLMGQDSTYQTAGMMNQWYDTVHSVTVSDFYMDTTEVTQPEFRGLMVVNSARFRDSADWAVRPVECLTWFDAVLYCNARSKIEGKDTV